MRRSLNSLLLGLSLGLLGCQDKESDLDDLLFGAPLFEGPFEYDSTYDGVHLIDILWIVSPQAVEEIEGLGQSPAEYLDWRLDALNDTMSRSLIDSSVVRSVGIHELNDDDVQRTGLSIGQTDVNIDTALTWLSSYRDSYGADKVIIVAGTDEGASGVALGGGDVSAHWVSFLPIEHEFGHQMGGSHCNEGDPDTYNYGFPLSGYDADGFPNGEGEGDAPDEGGTRMCGNSVALFSNPDLWLSLDELAAMVSEELAPDVNWSALANEDDMVRFGDPNYANMAQQWRDVEASSAARQPTARYLGEAGAPYAVDDCVGLFADEGYGDLIAELCEGESATELVDVSAIQLGADVHVNLYSDPAFGAESMCGGQLLRLGYSSPSLEAMSAHHGLSSFDDFLGSVSVYRPGDREAHFRNDGPYAFYGSGALPGCQGSSGDELVIMPDNHDWSATGAVYNSPVSIPFAVDFALRSSHSNSDPLADGFTFFFAKSADSYEGTTPHKDQLGFIPDGTGYAFMVNTWSGMVGLRDGSWSGLGSDKSHDSDTQDAWVPMRIEVSEDGVVVLWDGEELYSASVDFDTTHETVGFSAGTGYYTVEYRLRDIVYSSL